MYLLTIIQLITIIDYLLILKLVKCMHCINAFELKMIVIDIGELIEMQMLQGQRERCVCGSSS